MLRLLFALTCLAVVYCFPERIPYVVDQLWNALDKDFAEKVNRTSWVSFFTPYMRADPIFFELEVDENDFIQNWPNDVGGTIDEARSYYRILELDSAIVSLLTERDCELIILWCDGTWDEKNDEDEFRQWMPTLLRPVSWGVVFVRHDVNRDEYIDQGEFDFLFSSWDSDRDNLVTNPEFNNWFIPNNYGDEVAGNKTFNAFDNDKDGYLTVSEWNRIFNLCDDDGNSRLNFDEFLTIDFIVNGWPAFFGPKPGNAKKHIL